MVAESVGDIKTAICIDLKLGNYLQIIKRLYHHIIIDSRDYQVCFPILFRFHPNEFIDLLITKKVIIVTNILSLIASAGALTMKHKLAVIRYLEYFVLGYPDDESSLQSAYISILFQLKCETSVESDESFEIISFLESVQSRLDLDFAFRTVKQLGLVRFEIALLSISGMHLQAVEEAIKINDIQLAKQASSLHCRDINLQKNCEILILNSMNNFEDILKAYRESHVLDIGDMLTVLREKGIGNITMDIIHQEIVAKLNEYEFRSDKIENDICNYSQALELIRSDMMMTNKKSNHCVILSHSQKCEICSQLLFGEKFLVFNSCGHCFHNECLKDALTLRLVNVKNVDEVISKNCPLCGEHSLLIEDMFQPFVDPAIDQREIDMWTVRI